MESCARIRPWKEDEVECEWQDDIDVNELLMTA